LKLNQPTPPGAAHRRAPRGARGLKLGLRKNAVQPILSRPARGAWIETFLSGKSRHVSVVAPRAGRVD